MEGGCTGSGSPATRHRHGQEIGVAVRELLQLREFGRATSLLQESSTPLPVSQGSQDEEPTPGGKAVPESLGSSQPLQPQSAREAPHFSTPNPAKEVYCTTLVTCALEMVDQALRNQEELLTRETGLSKQQVYNWFANFRRRERRVNCQQESNGDLTPRTTRHSKKTHNSLMKCPETSSRDSNSSCVPRSGGDTAAESPCIVKEEQPLDGSSRNREQTVGQTVIQQHEHRGCCLGVSSDQLWLTKMGPAAMLGPTATMHWHGLPERASAQCQADMALCPWSSMAADPACAYPTTAPLQMAYTTRLSECQPPGSGFEKPTGLAPCYPSEDHPLQGVCGGSRVRPVSLPTTLYQPTRASPFSDAFLSSQQRPAIGVQLKEGTASAGQLPRWLLMCPTVTGYGVLDDSQIHSEGTVCEHDWLRASPSNPTCCLGSNKDPPSLTLGPMAPSRYGDVVTFPAGYDLVDCGMSVGEAGPISCAVTRQDPEADRQTDTEDFRQQSQWTPRAVSVDASPQSNTEHGEIRCGRLAHLKVLAEENCSLECNQVEAESELEIAAQALIQLSEAQRRHVRGEAYTL